MAVLPQTFVLVHGAWHGGWCWRRVADLLTVRGHRVVTPTLTGLGERAHLMTHRTDVMLHVEDIARVLVCEELEDVVLVGHSYAGPVITGVADREAPRVRRLIYLDAALLEDGEGLMDIVPPEMKAERLAAAIEVDGVPCMPAPPVAAFGITDPGDAAWVARHLTPQPLACFRDPLGLDNPVGNGLPADYILVTAPLYQPFEWSRQRARDKGFAMHELAAGHDAMVMAATPLTDLLEEIAV